MNKDKMAINVSFMDRTLYGSALLLGALAVGWTASIFVATDALAFTITVVIGGVYAIGVVELLKFGRATETLAGAMDAMQEKIVDFNDWLGRLDPSLRHAVKLRVEGERVGLPSPILTPYLVGLLVMLGLLGTFVGMVDTLRGAVAALEGTTELQAIRQGLAAPINGLGMAFGTSVAGVATSAMLGLMSTLVRRRRMLETRRLDAHTQNGLQNFSLVHSQRETFRALQRQTQSLPAVAATLDTVARKLDELGQALVTSQDRFQRGVADQYGQLAASMKQALEENLTANVRLVGETVKPVVDAVMKDMAQETQCTLHQMTQIGQQAVDQFGQRLVGQSQDHARSWKDMLAAVQKTGGDLITRMEAVLDTFTRQYDRQAASLGETFDTAAAGWLARQEASDQDRIARWAQALDAMQQKSMKRLSDVSTDLTAELERVAGTHRSAFDTTAQEFLSVSASLTASWQTAGEESRARQEALTSSLAQAVDGLAAHTQALGSQMQTQMSRLAQSSVELIQSRRDTEAAWVQDHAARMDALTKAVAEPLMVLRDDEDRRGQAAIARLGQLETVLTDHLSTLGRALEAPLARLVETASAAPRAAASLVEKMHKAAANQVHRDNRLLEERQRIMQRVDTLCASLNANLAGQHAAIEQLVDSSKGMLETVSRQLAEQVDKDVSRLTVVTDTFSVSAAEMASLGESFGKAVELFMDANHDLIEHLARIEDALEKTTARSDDQLGYVVAQAREIIEHSIFAQKEIFSELRRLRPKHILDLEAN